MKASAQLYEQVAGWPGENQLYDEVGDVTIGPDDRVYLLARRPNRVAVHDPDGTLVRSFGAADIRDGAHGVGVGPDLSAYVVNFWDHSVTRFTPGGQVAGVLGTSGVPSDTGIDRSLPYLQQLATLACAAGPFNGPTQLRFGPDGSFYVSDGYGNARIHRFSPRGELITSWGGPGTGPGEFRNPHDIDIDEDGNLFVADRENERVQVFDADGAVLDVWPGLRRASGIAARGGRVCVAHLEWRAGEAPYGAPPVAETQPAFISILDRSGAVLCTIDNNGGAGLAAPNGAAFDSKGDLYVVGVPWTFFGRYADPEVVAAMPRVLGVSSEHAAAWLEHYRPEWPAVLKFRKIV